jgi:hypothetical protein
MQLINALARFPHPVDDVMKLANRTSRSPKPHLFLDLLVGLAIFFESVGVSTKKYRSCDEVDDMTTAAKSALHLVEAELRTESV